jgi:predicted transcriptional regulator
VVNKTKGLSKGENESMEEKIGSLLEDIKKLIILSLDERGVKGKRIAAVLGVDAAVVSRILSTKKAKGR